MGYKSIYQEGKQVDIAAVFDAYLMQQALLGAYEHTKDYHGYRSYIDNNFKIAETFNPGINKKAICLWNDGSAGSFLDHASYDFTSRLASDQRDEILVASL